MILFMTDNTDNQKENGPKAILYYFTISISWYAQSRLISFDSFDYSDVLGIGKFPPRLIVYVHPASAHTLDLDLPAIHVNSVGVGRRDG